MTYADRLNVALTLARAGSPQGFAVLDALISEALDSLRRGEI